MYVFGVLSDLCYDSHRVSSLSSETLPLLCVTFITENSLVAAVSIKNFCNIYSAHIQLLLSQFIFIYLDSVFVYLIGSGDELTNMT